MQKSILFLAVLGAVIPCVRAQSVITTRLDDPQAVYLDAPEFGARGDGKADDSAAIQAAIDKAEHHAREGIGKVSYGDRIIDLVVTL